MYRAISDLLLTEAATWRVMVHATMSALFGNGHFSVIESRRGIHMRSQYTFLGILIFLGGCASPAMVPSKERLAQFDDAHIVALEAPPVTYPMWGAERSIGTAKRLRQH